MQTINRREDDLFKVCKYHYKHPTLSTKEILRKVIALHNGVNVGHVTDADLFAILLGDTAKLTLPDTDTAVRMLNEYLRSVNFNLYSKRMNGEWDAKPVGSTDELLTTYIGFVTMTEGSRFLNGLPENCPVVEEFIILPEDY